MRVYTLIRLYLQIGLALLGACGLSVPASGVGLDSAARMQPLAPHTLYWADADSSADLARVRQGVDWQPVPDNGMNFGFVDHPVWLQLELANASDEALQRYLVVNGPVVDHLEVFVFRGEQELARFHTGNALPYHTRLIDNRKFVIPLRFSPGDTQRIVVRVRERGSMQVPLQRCLQDQHTGDVADVIEIRVRSNRH